MEQYAGTVYYGGGLYRGKLQLTSSENVGRKDLVTHTRVCQKQLTTLERAAAKIIEHVRVTVALVYP